MKITIDKEEFKSMLAEIWEDYLNEFADWKFPEHRRAGKPSITDFFEWIGEKSGEKSD